MQARLDQLIVMVSDMRRSVGFYRDVLGLRAISESEWWSEFDVGNGTLALHPAPKAEAGGAVSGTHAGTLTVCLTVPDIEATCADLRAKGVEVDGPRVLASMQYSIATFADPDGLSLLLQPERS